MSILEIENLSLERGESLVLNKLTMEVKSNEILGLLGPSGCGKTSLLYALAGLLPLKSGSIVWDGKDITSVPVNKRNFGLVFQDHLLFPHKSVGENIAFGLKMSGWGKAEIKNRVGEMLELLELKGMENRRIQSLSGGQAQRVSLGRTLAPKPKLLLLDEPLAALDQTLRDTLSAEVREIIKSQKIPALYVTHDLREIFLIADRLMLMGKGRIHRSGMLEEIRNSPGDSYTADFFGLTNQITAKDLKELAPGLDIYPTDEICLIFPEGIELATKPSKDTFQVKVVDSRFMGSYWQTRFQAVQNPKINLVAHLKASSKMPKVNELHHLKCSFQILV